MARPNGFWVTDIGQLRVSTVGPLEFWQQGLPFNANGDLIVQVGDPAATDPFVGGLRVNESGVFVIVDTPPPIPDGFSNGFDTGYGAP